MSTINVNVATQDLPFPSGTTSGGIRITLTSADSTASPQIAATAPFSVTFPDVAPGDYLISAQAITAEGADIGAVVTNTINVPAPVMITVPLSLEVTLG